MSRNLLRLHEERNWWALDMTQTLDSCTVANTKLTVILWRGSLEGEMLEEPERERGSNGSMDEDLTM